jgi:hypothetical protein
VVRLWDPRQGERSIGKLIGHSDCVRSVIVSEDGRYVRDDVCLAKFLADSISDAHRELRHHDQVSSLLEPIPHHVYTC